MEKINIQISRFANIEALQEIDAEITDLQILKEEQEMHPTISRAPLDSETINLIKDSTKAIFEAGSLIKITGSLILGSMMKSTFIKSKEIIIKLIKSNNKQRGNVYGTKIILDKSLDKDKVQEYHFICDNIAENELVDALSIIQAKLESLNDLLGEEYLKKLKKIAFEYSDKEWKIIGIDDES